MPKILPIDSESSLVIGVELISKRATLAAMSDYPVFEIFQKTTATQSRRVYYKVGTKTTSIREGSIRYHTQMTLTFNDITSLFNMYKNHFIETNSDIYEEVKRCKKSTT